MFTMSKIISEEDSQVLEDTRLIAGYLRDAALSNNPFVLTINNQEIITNLLYIDENSARDKLSKRRLYLQVVGVNSKSKVKNNLDVDEIYGNKNDVSCRVAWSRNLIKFKTTLLSWEDDELVIEAPNVAGIISSRKKFRFNVGGLTTKSSLVSILKSGRTQSFAYFLIQDVSPEGVGGILESDNELPSPPFEIKGVLRQEIGEIELSGEVIRIDPLEKSFHSKYKYSVGINNYISEHKSSQLEKRSAKRIDLKIPIEIKSPINSRITITLEVNDLSYSGLSAKLFNNADIVMFKVGMKVLLISPELQMQVVSVSENLIRFKILPSNISEHIQLFNLKTKVGERDLAIKTPIPEDILQVYSVSGSLSSGLIKNIRLYRENILNSLSSNTHTKPWFLRWMQQNEVGRIKSIILTVPYGEHLWYCGGAAGHLDPTLKTSSSFFKRYFNANIDFFSTLGSQEYIAFNWFLDNERWGDWEDNLDKQEEDNSFFRFDGEIMYFKENTLSSENVDLDLKVQVKTIEQGDFKAIDEAMANINNKKLKQFVGLMGLNPYTFGGKSVKELLQYSSKQFDRKCYSLKIDDIDVVAIISNYPSYCSPNGILNYPFVFTSKFLSKNQLDILSFEMLKLTSSNGIECHGIFLTMNGRCHKLAETSNLYFRKVRWTFGPAERVWDYWKVLDEE